MGDEGANESAVSGRDADLTDGGELRFRRDRKQGLLMERDGEEITVGQLAVAFPLSSLDRYVSVADDDGSEIVMIRDISALDADSLKLLRAELERVYFMPRIEDVANIDVTLGVYRWEVTTDRGERVFEVRHPRHNIRRLGSNRFIVRDVDGNRYDIPDWNQLPAAAREIVAEYT